MKIRVCEYGDDLYSIKDFYKSYGFRKTLKVLINFYKWNKIGKWEFVGDGEYTTTAKLVFK